MNLVNKHGNGWRYEYNAHKSAILDHGVNKRTHDHNAVFNLGGKRYSKRTIIIICGSKRVCMKIIQL